MSKLSKTSRSIHSKWQIEAEAKGGKGAKIVLAQLEAKKLISNLLKDSFRPMNITSIYEVSRFTFHVFGTFSKIEYETKSTKFSISLTY